ncbi:MAG TPA: hypothetical protein VEA77_02510 [Hyphomicrobium sp.]|nr:hypothetical protein [Hyphomicrobium sp.]
MRITSRSVHCGLVTAAILFSPYGYAALAAAIPTGVVVSTGQTATSGALGPIQVADRMYRDYRPAADSAPPVRRYRNPDPPTPPPAAKTKVYGWSSRGPRGTDCGQFRYWNGDRCVDARDEPPNVGAP